MQTATAAPSAPASVDDALNSSTWFQQQRFWEETTRVQTQLLALLQKQQAQPAATEGKQRRPRRNSVSPVSHSSFKKTTPSVAPAFPSADAQPAARRRGSWSSSLAAAQSAAILGLTDEAAAVSAMQLLALAHDVRHANGGSISKRDAKRASNCSSPFGKAKEAEPYGSFDEDAGDLQPHPDFLASSMAFAPTPSSSSSSSSPATSSHHAPMPERKNVMSISALLN